MKTKYPYNNYTFFWGGVHSQWYQSSFTINGVQFNCAEQYMMYSKAKLFGDEGRAIAIMNTPDPSAQKMHGRNVARFREELWNQFARTIVFRGNIAKYTQNDFLFKELLKTRDTLLVEASPQDRIWGIGLSEKDARDTPVKEWPGENWLGETLTDVREALMHLYTLNDALLAFAPKGTEFVEES